MNFKLLLCSVLGHQYFVRKEFGNGARQVGCFRCREKWAMHDGTKSFLLWDADFENIYFPNNGKAKGGEA